MVFAFCRGFLEARDRASIRLGALQEATISSNGVADAVLGGAMEF